MEAPQGNQNFSAHPLSMYPSITMFGKIAIVRELILSKHQYYTVSFLPSLVNGTESALFQHLIV